MYTETGKERYLTDQLISVVHTTYNFRSSVLIRIALENNHRGYDKVFRLAKNIVKLNELESGCKLGIQITLEALIIFSTTGMDEDYFINGKKYVVILR